MKSTATALWKGSLKEGAGHLSALSGHFKNLPYTFVSRFVDGSGGTTPEELIAAAHAGCFSMFLSAELGKAGFVPESIETSSSVSIEAGNIDSSHLVVKARVPGVSKEEFMKLVETSKQGCPVSKVLNTQITLEVTLL
jgi:osmotically inducible protein OsmC